MLLPIGKKCLKYCMEYFLQSILPQQSRYFHWSSLHASSKLAVMVQFVYIRYCKILVSSRLLHELKEILKQTCRTFCV